MREKPPNTQPRRTYLNEIREGRFDQMSGHTPFKELTKEWPKKRRLRIEKRNIEQTAATDQHRETRLLSRHLSSDSSSDKPKYASGGD